MGDVTTVQLEEIKGLLERVLERLEAGPPREKPRGFYSVEEVAKIMNRTPYTVRDWCRLGRIHAVKRGQKWGGGELWSIASEEVERIREDGLLGISTARNG